MKWSAWKYAKEQVGAVKCLCCGRRIGKEAHRPVPYYIKHRCIAFIHERCQRAWLANRRWTRFLLNQKRICERETENVFRCLSHHTPWGGVEARVSWACERCRAEYQRRMEETKRLGDEAAARNNEEYARRLRGIPVEECRKMEEHHSKMPPEAPPAPYAAGDYDSWSIVVRAYEDLEFLDLEDS